MNFKQNPGNIKEDINNFITEYQPVDGIKHKARECSIAAVTMAIAFEYNRNNDYIFEINKENNRHKFF